MTNVCFLGIQLAPTGHSVLMKGQALKFKLIVQVGKLCVFLWPLLLMDGEVFLFSFSMWFTKVPMVTK